MPLKVARGVQILALTCRPEDYVDTALLPEGDASFRDSEDGLVRAVDLVRVITRASTGGAES